MEKRELEQEGRKIEKRYNRWYDQDQRVFMNFLFYKKVTSSVDTTGLHGNQRYESFREKFKLEQTRDIARESMRKLRKIRVRYKIENRYDRWYDQDQR